VPQWMFDPAVCCRMHKVPVPVVGCEALRDLKALLREVALFHRDVVLKAQHRSLLSRGGFGKADSKQDFGQGSGAGTQCRGLFG
jgi:hypothetical protein